VNEIGTLVGLLAGEVVNRLTPDFLREFADYNSIMKVFRNSFNTIAVETLKTLIDDTLQPKQRFANNRVISRVVANHGAFVLRGWDEELRFLSA
jgi:hypothetical protein